MFLNFLFKRKQSDRFTGVCRQCGACCRSLILVHRGKPVTSLRQFERLAKRKPAYRNFHLVREEEDTGILYFSCSNLGEDGRCSAYEARPRMCREYPRPRMLELGGSLPSGCGYGVPEETPFSRILEEESRIQEAAPGRKAGKKE